MHEQLNTPPCVRRLRMDIEGTIVRYPNIEDHELEWVLKYLRKQASAMDKAMIASNETVRSQYRRLCHDHYLDRLRPGETIALSVFSVSILSLIAWLSLHY